MKMPANASTKHEMTAKALTAAKGYFYFVFGKGERKPGAEQLVSRVELSKLLRQ